MDNSGNEPRRSNPRDRANVFSFLTFAYTFGLFRRGARDNLQDKDIYSIPEDCNSKECGGKTELEWKRNKTLIKLLWRRFKIRYSVLFILHLIWIVFNSIVEPHVTSKFISFFQKRSKTSRNDAYFYAGAVIGLSIIRCFWAHNYHMLQCKLEIQIKASLTSLIYRKVLKLKPGEISKTNMGNMVTILTKDVKLMVHNIWTLSNMTIGIIQIFVVFYLLYAKLGPPSGIAIGMLCGGLIAQVMLTRTITNLRLKVGKMADKRLQLTQEALSALRIIKMYTWEMFFFNRICSARKKEMQKTMSAFYLRVCLILMGIIGSKITFPVLLISYLALGYSTTTELVFYIISIFKEIRYAAGIAIPLGLTHFAEFYASMTRVSKLLHIEEHSPPAKAAEGKPKIVFQDVAVSIRNENILKDLSFNISTPGLNVITGPVGSGKSSLLKAILSDYPASKGSLTVCGSVSYASQDSWLFPSTIKQNILFGQALEENRYQEVLKVCCLEYDLNLLPQGDETVVADGGMNLSKGQQARINLARAIYKRSEIYLLDDSLAALDVRVQEDIYNNCIRNYLREKIVLFVSQNSAHVQGASTVIILNKGSIKSVSDLSEVGELGKLGGSSITEEDDQEDRALMEVVKMEPLESKRRVYQEEKREGRVELGTYLRYIKFGGGLMIFALILCLYLAAQSTESYSTKLLSRWVNYQQQVYDLSVGNNVTSKRNESLTYEQVLQKKGSTFNLYAILIFSSGGFALLRSYSILRFCRRGSVKTHQVMCSNVIHCLMTFMDNHFIGNILNRFSYDLDIIDEYFPYILMEFTRRFFSIAGMLILIATVNWVFLLLAVGFFFVLYLLRMAYMPTGRALKRLEAMTRSPLVGHLNASMEGLTTIRAYKAEDVLKDEFDKHQDLANSTYYMVATTSAAFGFAMDVAATAFVVSIILILLFVDIHISVGDVGLALTQVMMLTHFLQWAVLHWAELENCMTSVERALEYTEIKQEESKGGAVNDWPRHGSIEYQSVDLSYNRPTKVLKNVNFTVNAGEKVGIVGRTGAGKSSVLSTLFRLYDYEGKILIDGVDIASVSINFLRRSISVIPQDPVTFEGSIRDNLDPHKLYTDKQLWNVLDRVRMKHLISGLDEDIVSLSLSTGQKQLLSLARAVMKRNKILILDEATANMDEEADLLVNELIRESFSNCTVIMIAHRLSTILGCDKVMVLDNGNVAEYGDPKTLLANKDSLFYAMKNQTTRIRDQ